MLEPKKPGSSKSTSQTDAAKADDKKTGKDKPKKG